MRAIVAELLYAAPPPEGNLTLLTALSLPQSRTVEVCAGVAYRASVSPCGTLHLPSPGSNHRLAAFAHAAESPGLMTFQGELTTDSLSKQVSTPTDCKKST